MTKTKTHPADTADTERPGRRRPKGVLFCPTCGHESALGGDWHVEYRAQSLVRHCPECHTVVSEQ